MKTLEAQGMSLRSQTAQLKAYTSLLLSPTMEMNERPNSQHPMNYCVY